MLFQHGALYLLSQYLLLNCVNYVDNLLQKYIKYRMNIISGKAGGAPPTSREVIMGIMIPLILGVSYTCPSLIFIIHVRNTLLDDVTV